MADVLVRNFLKGGSTMAVSLLVISAIVVL
jgi:hypothetical protein